MDGWSERHLLNRTKVESKKREGMEMKGRIKWFSEVRSLIRGVSSF